MAGPEVQLMLPVGVNSWALKYYKIDQTADTKIQKLRHARKSLPVLSALYSLLAHTHRHTDTLCAFMVHHFLGSVIKSIKVKVELFFYSLHSFTPCLGNVASGKSVFIMHKLKMFN